MLKKAMLIVLSVIILMVPTLTYAQQGNQYTNSPLRVSAYGPDQTVNKNTTYNFIFYVEDIGASGATVSGYVQMPQGFKVTSFSGGTTYSGTTAVLDDDLDPTHAVRDRVYYSLGGTGLLGPNTYVYINVSGIFEQTISCGSVSSATITADMYSGGNYYSNGPPYAGPTISYCTY